MIDPSKIDNLITVTNSETIKCEGTLRNALDRVGMVKGYIGHDPQLDFYMALQGYIHSAAKLEMLKLMTSETFYAAMMRSAAEVTE